MQGPTSARQQRVTRLAEFVQELTISRTTISGFVIQARTPEQAASWTQRLAEIDIAIADTLEEMTAEVAA